MKKKALFKIKENLTSNYSPGDIIDIEEFVMKINIKNKESTIQELKEAASKISADSDKITYEQFLEILNFFESKNTEEYDEIVTFFKEQKKFSKVKEERLLTNNQLEEVLSSFKEFIQSIPIPLYKVYITSSVPVFKEYYKKYNQPDILIVYLPKTEEKIKELILEHLKSLNIKYEEVGG